MGVRVKDEGQFKEIYVKALDSLPVGTSVEYAGTTIPDELKGTWLFERGQELSRTEYAKLFSIIGTSYGVGDGSTTFNLPNKCGRVPVGLDENDTDFDTIGETGGEKKHTMKINELVKHHHGVIWNNAGAHSGIQLLNGGSDANYQVVNTTETGDGQPFNVMQPYIVKNYIIKVKETRPLASHTVNAYSENKSNAYSCDYINGALDYSTDEVNTHKKWIDGKDIYRKVYHTGSLSLGTTPVTIPSGLTNISTIIDINFIYKFVSGGNVVWYKNWNLNELALNGTNIYISTYQSATFNDSYVTIEYTKTTQSNRSVNTYSGDIEEKKDIAIDDGNGNK